MVALLRADRLRQPANGAPDALLDDSLGRTTDLVPMSVDRRIVERVVALHADLALIDLHDARFDAVRLCRALCAAQVRRIVVLSPTVLADQLLIDLLDAGADDVIVDASAAMRDARLRVALRRSPPRQRLPPLLEIGDLRVDLRAHEVQIAGRPVRCPPVQYELLVALARDAGTTIAADDLLRAVWGAAPGDVHPRRLRVAVSVLRNILGLGPHRPRLETVARVGYRLITPAN